jgi:quercetin dioxygenase-like cupin family protein
MILYCQTKAADKIFTTLSIINGTFMKINIDSDVQYQSNAIVSKTILKNDGGNITLFAFDAQQALSEHTAPFDAAFTCVDGKFRITIGADEHQVIKNELIILPANIPHSVTAMEQSKCLLVMIKTKM